MKVAIPKKNSLATLMVLVLFVYADVVCENFIVIINDLQQAMTATALLIGFVILQIFFAPIQSGFSDFYGRRKSLIISLAISFIAIFFSLASTQFTYFAMIFLVVANGIKGVWGNTTPISLAAIADTQDSNQRGAFALASGMFALAYITLVIINFFSLNSLVLIYSVGVILLISLILSWFKFRDPEDDTAKLPYEKGIHTVSRLFPSLLKIGKKEVHLIRRELQRPLTRAALGAYILWEISMYAILVSQVDFNHGNSKLFVLVMMGGYLFGVGLLWHPRYKKIKDSNILKAGFLFAFFSLVPYFLLFKFFNNENFLLGFVYALHALGNAFLSPATFSILVKNRSAHEQGKILGLVDSADMIAFLVAIFFVIIYVKLNIPLFYLILFSFLIFSVSWIFFGKLKLVEELEIKTETSE